MNTLDACDRQIVKILDSDGTISISDLARKVRRGRDMVAYRLRRLEEQGILKGVEPIIDPATLGGELFKTYLSFVRSSHGMERALGILRKHPAVYCAARAYGRWDLIFNMVAKDVRHYSNLRSELLEHIGQEIREMTSAAFTEMIFFNRKYLGAKIQKWTTLTKISTDEYDDTFRKVLRRLCLDARVSEAQIAKDEGVTPIVVRTRLNQAHQRGVIVGYRARFDRSAFDLSSYKLHIELRRYSEDSIKTLRVFAETHPYVSQFMQHIGGWPCEMNVEAHDTRHIASIIEELRDSGGEALGLIEVSLYDKDSFSWGFGV
jgi:Lrp/AsnC family leucine-responsive transcriptional regulator